MPYFVERTWQPDPHSYLSRKDRTPGAFNAFVPDELGTELPELGHAARQAAENAAVVLGRLDQSVTSSSSGYLNHLLIRSESISSSWIEGNRITPKKLAIAEALQSGDSLALDVIGNVHATESAIDALSDPASAITVEDIEELQHTIEPRLDRGIRKEQNWVGGPGNSPLRADFVPPPEFEVPRLLADLARFVSVTEGNPVVRAAIAHAQFETIHPFTDGNGRTGRALIHTVLKRADLLRTVLVPVSTVFSGNVDAYIGGLTAYRSDPPRLDEWVIGFADAVEAAAGNAAELLARVEEVAAETFERLIAHREALGRVPARPRRNAVVLRILAGLARTPVLTIEGVAVEHGVSRNAAHRALVELEEAGILRRSKNHKGKTLCWSADGYFDLVALTERSNRIGGGDTSGRQPRLAPPHP